MGRRKRHQRCLANIDRLERELYPEWFPQQLDNAVALKQLAARNLFFSGAAAKVDWLEDRPAPVR